MTTTIAVCGLSTGVEDEDVANIRNISLEFEHETTTLRELIARTVNAQIQNLNQVAGLTDEDKQAQLRHRYTGKKEATAATPIHGSLHLENEVEKAWYGFERQYYMVIVNGCQIMTLEEKVLLTNHSEVIFLRLMPLVGG